MVYWTLYDTSIASEIEFQYDVLVSKEGNYTSIQQAIDSASNNNIIFVSQGIYYENIVIDKPIVLIGENKTLTIIDGRNAGNVIKINSKFVTVQQFTIQHSGMYFPNAGINLSATNATIQENIMKNNFYGMTMYNAQYNAIQNNSIFSNDHCGIYMSGSSFNFLLNNTVSNHTYNGFGIYDSSNNNVIKNNILTKNRYCGINLRISSDNIIIDNNISNNNIGIHIPNTENTIKDNVFSNNNKRLDKELKIPGLEFIGIIIAVVIFYFYHKFTKKLK
jgi:nitrous oxidase accessory protein